MSPLALGILASARAASAPVVPTYRGTAFKTSAGLAAKTYAAAPIGTASATRTVIVLVTGWSGGSRSITGVTIGGIAATEDHSNGDSVNHFAEVWRAVVPTGTTADVVATCTDGTPEISIHVWTTDVLIVKASSASTTLVAGSTTGVVTAPTTFDGGFVIAGFGSRSTAFSSTWTDLTERYDSTVSNQPSSVGDAATAGGAHAVTLTPSVATTTSQTRLAVIAYRSA